MVRCGVHTVTFYERKARQGRTRAQMREKGQLTPGNLAERDFCSIKAILLYTVLPVWRQSAGLQTSRRIYLQFVADAESMSSAL